MAEGAAAIVEVSNGPRGIPSAKCIVNLKDFLGTQVPGDVLNSLKELYRKYCFLEINLKAQLARLASNLPALREPLETVETLLKRRAENKCEEETIYYRLSENCFAQATVPQPEVVYLWLGANTMLEYTLDDAKASLSKSVESATKQVALLETDIKFLRRQMAIAELNMSRMQNMIATESRGVLPAAAAK